MWYVCVPVWGDRYVDLFCRRSFPSILAAAARVKTPVRLVVYTYPEFENLLRQRLTAHSIEYHDLSKLLKGQDHHWETQLTCAHNHAMGASAMGDYLCLMVADMVLSPEVFEASEKRFAQEFDVVAASCVRVYDREPDTSSAPALLRWAWANRHEITDKCIMPGATVLNWASLYFPRDDGSVSARTRYYHPIAIHKKKTLHFWGTTIDAGLLSRFKHEEIHLVTSPTEMAIVDMSGEWRKPEYTCDPMHSGMKHMQDDYPFKSHVVTIIPPPPPNWLIGVPCWGERHTKCFIECTLPAMKRALERINGNFRFLIHTDRKDLLAPHFEGYEVHFLPVPPGIKHQCVGKANNDALRLAHMGDAIALINADMVPSIEVFEAAERRFLEGKKIIMAAGTRTTNGNPPAGYPSRQLLEWAWAHRQHWIRGTTWGSGKCKVPSVLHFTDGVNVAVHAFHMQPYALIKDRELAFERQTADDDLPEKYTLAETHVVTSPDECGFAEMSPEYDERFVDGPKLLDVFTVGNWAKTNVRQRHLHFFMRRICLVGEDKDLGDSKVCLEILAEATSKQPR